ncbi:MAG: DUF2703 domain-containing protein [Proteobacteria bacterium]|nr:DUF2703 domain-containing protein [Pseudomonadota bacterium]
MKFQKQGESKGGKASCGCGCGCVGSASPDGAGRSAAARPEKKTLDVELLVIDLETCERCVPTGEQLGKAVRLLQPVAEALGIELRHQEYVIKNREEAKARALTTSPTIRLNGRDIDQNIRESVCESCGDLTGNDTVVECREWHYRGEVFPSAPLPMLIEVITGALLSIDEMQPATPDPLEELPENLERYFQKRKQNKPSSPCCC